VNRRLRPLHAAILASALLASSAHAQLAPARSEALPVLNRASGKVEAVLLLEPMTARTWRFGSTTLDTAFGVGAGSQLGLVCDRTAGLTSAIGKLADNCMLASLGNRRDSRQANAGAAVSRPSGRVGVSVGSNRETLPTWLAPGRVPARVDENTLTLKGERNVGHEATVSIGGTLARARLVSPDAVPALSDRWDVRTVSLGARVGAFGANIIGRVVDSPASSEQWRGLDLGLTWRTPWSGQLSIGAQNVVTRGKNPFAPKVADADEDAVPYVRYQQDL
jgi:hypothetical protein